MESKHGQLNLMLLVTASVAFVIFGVASSVGAQVIAEVENNLDDKTTGNVAYNATQNANKGIEELTSWSDIIAIVIAASIVLGIVGLFMVR